jgi:hypothetical protein
VNRTIATVIGVVMILCGVAIIVKSAVTGRPVTTSRFIDAAFAFFFFVRGWMQLRAARAPRPPLS